MAAVSLGIARHAIDILLELAQTRTTVRSLGGGLREDATVHASVGQAEGLVGSGRAFLYDTLEEAWHVVKSGQALSPAQRARLWLASTQAAIAGKQATELIFSAGSSASPYIGYGIERCVRDIHAAAQHILVSPGNYQMAGQAFLGLDMSKSLLMLNDDRSAP
jgi:alkylation response protein AidB-like acyl-CoA dehydrogenase